MLCWKCLTCFLHLNSLQESFVKNEFITHPLVHELIKFHLPNLQESKEMKEFFILWLEENSVLVDDPCFGRKIFGEFFKDTVQNVKSYLDENLMQKDLVIYEKVINLLYIYLINKYNECDNNIFSVFEMNSHRVGFMFKYLIVMKIFACVFVIVFVKAPLVT